MKLLNKILFLIAFTLILVGCKVGENYTRPDMQLPEDFYIRNLNDTIFDKYRQDSTQTSQLKWKEFFNDSILVELIQAALQDNIALKKAMANVDIDYQTLQQARVNNLPEVAGRAGYIREYFSDNYYSNPSSKYYDKDTPPSSFYTQKVQNYARIGASWEIDVWGKLARRREIAIANYNESIEVKKALQTYLVSEIATSYYTLLMLRSQLSIAKSNLNLNNNTLSVLKLQYEAGEVTSLAVQQVESQMLRSKMLIPQIEQAFFEEEVYLNSLLGRYPQRIELDVWLENIDPETIYGNGVPLDLITNRPDVLASEYALIQTNAKVGIAQAMKYPSITLDATLGLDGMRFKDLFDPVGSGLAFLNGSLFQPIFQNRKLKTNHKIAIIEREKAQLDYKEKVIEAVGEVSTALVTIERIKEEYEIAQQRMEVDHKGVRSAMLLFKSGFANYLEVISAQSNSLDSELNLARTKMRLLISNVNLYRSLGGGWE